MRHIFQQKKVFCYLLMPLLVLSCTACNVRRPRRDPGADSASAEPNIAHFLVAIEDEPDTVDFQCTSIHYTIAQNVFNRLVEMENDDDGEMQILPSLAKSWEISDDGITYTFHLQENVRFSNGNPLTSSDVQYTFTRLLTHPDSCNRDIVDGILGAEALINNDTDTLEGLTIINDLDFTITLEYPFQAFLACLSMPGASILDQETTEEAGDRFGTVPEWTIGTGSFVLWKWIPEEKMLLTANPDCWLGPPKCEGLDLRFITDSKEIRRMFEDGEIDVLDLDELGNTAEFFLHGKIYQDRLFNVPRIGITYIALNENIAPLNDVRVRKALQLSLNRAMLLTAVYSGRGSVENGIFPHGLYGYNPDLPDIPYDLEEARRLLDEAGYPDNLDFTVSVNSASTRWEMSVLRLATFMWSKIGVRAKIEVLNESEFMRLRKSGQLACYTALWSADFNDPDNFIYTFFGTSENTTFRSLCYNNTDVMDRIRLARTIVDPDERIREYQDLERIIVHEDAGWIPLYSRLRYYVTSERLRGIQASWNGSVKNKYREMSIVTDDQQEA
ncbi:MAG: ABC transporter substrate-binding protein [Lachnospiraceae bacterium]|nr:ABC transporter substrate-binding protein [Lachnospiraceae bacterium]